MNNIKWTPEEDAMLRAGVFNLPNRTVAAAKHRAVLLKIKVPRAGAWTQEEDAYLLNNYKSVGHKEMAKSLGRSLAAIQNRVRTLGAINGRTPRDWTPRGENSHLWTGGWSIERDRSYNAARRQRKKEKMSPEDRIISVEYRKAIANDACFYCGALGEHDDHYFPLAKGGTDHWWNLVRACSSCNLSKGPKCGTKFILRRK